MNLRFCDETTDGFGWIVDEAMTRTSHALVAEGRVWLVDPVDWPEAVERATGLGEPAGVVQLLDRHKRGCAAIAERLGLGHLVTPDEIPGTPFEVVPVMRRKRWQERALWWPDARTLVTADALATNRFYTGGKGRVGVHILLRLTPPRLLGRLEGDRTLVGHGEGVLADA